MDKATELTIETFIPVGITPRMIGQVVEIIEQVRVNPGSEELLPQKCHVVGKLLSYQAKGNKFMVILEGSSKTMLFEADRVHIEVLRGIDA